MGLPVYYFSARLAQPLVVLPQMGLVYLESDRDTAFFVHIPNMIASINHAIAVHDGDVDFGGRFEGHWAVVRLHLPGSVIAFTVWGHDWGGALARIRGLQRLARARVPAIKARRANELAKLTAFKRHALPSELVQLILTACVLRCPEAPPGGACGVCRIETASYRRLRGETPAASLK
jgi:hypothetical protein